MSDSWFRSFLQAQWTRIKTSTTSKWSPGRSLPTSAPDDSRPSGAAFTSRVASSYFCLQVCTEPRFHQSVVIVKTRPINKMTHKTGRFVTLHGDERQGSSRDQFQLFQRKSLDESWLSRVCLILILVLFVFVVSSWCLFIYFLWTISGSMLSMMSVYRKCYFCKKKYLLQINSLKNSRMKIWQ